MAQSAELKRELGAAEYFTLSFGVIVGVGWVVVLGDWLTQAGPAGSILAFVIGGVALLLVGFCYAEMSTRLPVSGGEVAYAYEIFGVPTCFATGWFLTLSYIATTVFEALSISWLAATLLPSVQGRVLYVIHGSQVHTGTLLLGLASMMFIVLLNYQGVRQAALLQNILTYAKILLAVVVVAIGVGWGRTAHLQPLFRRSAVGSVWPGVLAVLITTPFFLSGFSTVVQVMEEKATQTSLKTVGWMIVLSISAATLFYCLIILACSMTIPWQQLVKLNLPAATAFDVAFQSRLLMRSVLVVALFGNFTVLNGVFLSASRVVFALGRAHIISSRFGAILPTTGTPAVAIVFVGILGFLGIFLGQGALLPMVNITSSCIAFCYVLVCLGVILMRVQQKTRAPYEVPGGVLTAALGMIASLCILCIALYQPYLDAGRSFPLEWSLIVLWSVLGALFWFAAQKIRGTVSDAERRKIVLEAGATAE